MYKCRMCGGDLNTGMVCVQSGGEMSINDLLGMAIIICMFMVILPATGILVKICIEAWKNHL